jgi:hypothetical protein
MFVVYAKQFAEFRDLHGAAARFQLFDQVHACPPAIGVLLTLLRPLLAVQYFSWMGQSLWNMGPSVRAIVDCFDSPDRQFLYGMKAFPPFILPQAVA